jgi:hypothetical protein
MTQCADPEAQRLRVGGRGFRAAESYKQQRHNCWPVCKGMRTLQSNIARAIEECWISERPSRPTITRDVELLLREFAAFAGDFRPQIEIAVRSTNYLRIASRAERSASRTKDDGARARLLRVALTARRAEVELLMNVGLRRISVCCASSRGYRQSGSRPASSFSNFRILCKSRPTISRQKRNAPGRTASGRQRTPPRRPRRTEEAGFGAWRLVTRSSERPRVESVRHY